MADKDEFLGKAFDLLFEFAVDLVDSYLPPVDSRVDDLNERLATAGENLALVIQERDELRRQLRSIREQNENLQRVIYPGH